MTDHRINLTLYKLDAVMEGDLTELAGQPASRISSGSVGHACTAEIGG